LASVSVAQPELSWAMAAAWSVTMARTKVAALSARRWTVIGYPNRVVGWRSKAAKGLVAVDHTSACSAAFADRQG
jgi:hypothetical protein